MVLRNTRTGLLVARVVEPALTSSTRRRGLLGREGLARDHALAIAPTNLVHTFAMRFAIDIVFVRRDGVVLKVCPAVARRRIAGALRAFAVIEMAAGAVSPSGTRAGDLLRLDPA